MQLVLLLIPIVVVALIAFAVLAVVRGRRTRSGS
jgi:hypothetical protein